MKTLFIVISLLLTTIAPSSKFERNENKELTDEQGENEYDKPKDTPVDGNILFFIVAGVGLVLVIREKVIQKRNSS